MDQAPGQGPLRLKGSDGKGIVELDFREASGPYPKEVLSRAEPRPVLGVEIRVARCEDLILYWSSADLPGSADRIVELLRVCAGSIDAAYLKKQAEAAGVFDRLKECWKRAKEPV